MGSVSSSAASAARMRQPPENSASGRSWSADREAEPGQHAARLGLERVLVVQLEVMLQFAGPLQQRLELRVVGRDAGQPLVQRVQFLAHRQQRAVRLQRAVQHRAVEALGGLLRQVAEPGAACDHALARPRA